MLGEIWDDGFNVTYISTLHMSEIAGKIGIRGQAEHMRHKLIMSSPSFEVEHLQSDAAKKGKR